MVFLSIHLLATKKVRQYPSCDRKLYCKYEYIYILYTGYLQRFNDIHMTTFQRTSTTKEYSSILKLLPSRIYA